MLTTVYDQYRFSVYPIVHDDHFLDNDVIKKISTKSINLFTDHNIKEVEKLKILNLKLNENSANEIFFKIGKFVGSFNGDVKYALELGLTEFVKQNSMMYFISSHDPLIFNIKSNNFLEVKFILESFEYYLLEVEVREITEESNGN